MYRTVGHGAFRHAVVDRESHEMEMRVTPNLADDEFKIELLMVVDCPMRTSCVRMEEGLNSICNCLGLLPYAEDSRPSKFTGLICRHGGESQRQKVSELWVEGCTLGKNCAGCEDLLNIDIPVPFEPAKSHAFITCRTRRRR